MDDDKRVGQRSRISRRGMLQTGGVAAVAGALGSLGAACAQGGDRARAAGADPSPVKLTSWLAPSERETNDMPAPLPWDQRVGFAIVGLGRLALEEILPAFAASKRCRVTALVSGDAAKAEKVAAQYGVPKKSVHDYASFDRLKDDPAVDVVYIVLPNSLHAEYTARAAQAGKHVLCEKPMANSVAECQQMIDACNRAGRKLMVAYRMQYEPYNREVIRLARGGELGRLRALSAVNGQTQGDPTQWCLKLALAGGGPLPDVGIYCINAARYLTGDEPTEVQAMMYRPDGDPRFAEVEEEVSFSLRFPGGFTATCVTSYGFHDAKSYRLLGESGWAELDPAFPYQGQRLRVGRKANGSQVETIEERSLAPKNQFALEMDHMAVCVTADKRPHTPGEEGMQDMKIVAAIYDAARTGTVVKLPPVNGKDAFRGPLEG